MNFKLKLLFSVVSLGLLTVGLSTTTHAATIYTYTGRDFTSFSGPYTAADSVSGYFIVASALGANLTDFSVSPTSFSFTDGVQTLNTPGLNTFFLVDTDAAGDITHWFVELVAGPGAPVSNIETYTVNFEPGFTKAVDVGEIEANNGQMLLGEGFVNDSGSWTSAPVPTPEPGTFTLFFSGMLGLGLFAGMKRNRENRLATEA